MSEHKLYEWLSGEYGPFMDTNEIADMLRIKKTTVYQQIYLGKLDLPHIRRGKKYLFPTVEVAKYCESKLQNGC